MTNRYDAIVVGARCAGSPTAMLLARQGYRVLLVDRATFPSDTMSTHIVHAPGLAALDRWQLLERLRASGCPPFERYSFDLNSTVIAGTPHPFAGISGGIAPRRTVLDKILVDAADTAGAEVREGFSVSEIVVEGGVVVGIRGRDSSGAEVTERARVVIGADGRNSSVAKAVAPVQYNEKPRMQWSYYSYWSGLPTTGFENVGRPDRGWAAVPTNDGLTMLVVGWPYAETQAFKADVEGNFLATLELAPEFAARVRAAKREERFFGGTADNYFRQPFGPGWALVGDAGYSKDSITAQGIGDAFRDAESCAGGLDAWLSGASTYDDAMARYHRERDARAEAIYELTTQLATLQPPDAQLQQLLDAMTGQPAAMDAFVSVMAGTMAPDDFFGDDNVAAIVQRARAL